MTIAAYHGYGQTLRFTKTMPGCNGGNYDDDPSKYEVEGDKCVCKNGGKCNMLNHQDPEKTRFTEF